MVQGSEVRKNEHRTSNVQHRMLNEGREKLNIVRQRRTKGKGEKLNIEHRTSNPPEADYKHRMLNEGRKKLNIERRTSNIE